MKFGLDSAFAALRLSSTHFEGKIVAMIDVSFQYDQESRMRQQQQQEHGRFLNSVGSKREVKTSSRVSTSFHLYTTCATK